MGSQKTWFKYIRWGVMLAVAMSGLWSAAALAHPAADTEVLWQMDCGVDHFGPDDPIVHPGQAGDSHMHSFYGNSSTNANSTAASMLAASSSCGRNMQTSDHSGYWVPSLYLKGSNGGMTLVKNEDQGMFIYYRRPGGASGPKITPFPAGLKIVAGNSGATSAQSLYVVDWDCGGGGPEFGSIPNCSNSDSGHDIHASIEFPNCWDGKHLDSADHKSHMAYANADSGACPADHPVSLPQVTFEVDYPHISGGSGYVLSSGSPYSMHADFFAAWDPQVQNALVYGCLNKGLDCIDVNRDGGLLTQAPGEGTLSSPIRLADYPSTGQVLADQTSNAAPAPSAAAATVGTTATPASALPDTGPASLAGGALALGVVAFVVYQFRFRRRSLLEALRKAGRPAQK